MTKEQLFSVCKKIQPILSQLKNSGKIKLAYLQFEEESNVIEIALFVTSKTMQDEFLIHHNIKEKIESIMTEIGLKNSNVINISLNRGYKTVPLKVQEALNGISLIEQDEETYYMLSQKVLHIVEDLKAWDEKHKKNDYISMKNNIETNKEEVTRHETKTI